MNVTHSTINLGLWESQELRELCSTIIQTKIQYNTIQYSFLIFCMKAFKELRRSSPFLVRLFQLSKTVRHHPIKHHLSWSSRCFFPSIFLPQPLSESVSSTPHASHPFPLSLSYCVYKVAFLSADISS